MLDELLARPCSVFSRPSETIDNFTSIQVALAVFLLVWSLDLSLSQVVENTEKVETPQTIVLDMGVEALTAHGRITKLRQEFSGNDDNSH